MNEWERRGLFYYSEYSMRHGGLGYWSKKKYFFITFWLIAWIHGADEMYKLSSKYYLESQLK